MFRALRLNLNAEKVEEVNLDRKIRSWVPKVFNCQHWPPAGNPCSQAIIHSRCRLSQYMFIQTSRFTDKLVLNISSSSKTSLPKMIDISFLVRFGTLGQIFLEVKHACRWIHIDQVYVCTASKYLWRMKLIFESFHWFIFAVSGELQRSFWPDKEMIFIL